MLKQKLDEKDISFLDVEDEQRAIELGQKYTILSAPIVEIDGEFFNIQQASKVLKL